MRRLWVVLLLAGCGAPSPGAELLTAGRHREVLRTVRPNSQPAAWARACAWWRLGKTREARQEVLVGLARDRKSARGHRLLGAVEARLGSPGAALTHLQRSLELEPRQPRVRRAVAALLRRRAQLRVGPGMGPHQVKEAREDIGQALELMPSERADTCQLARALARPRPANTPRPGHCFGPPPARTLLRSAAAPGGDHRCRKPRAARRLEQLRRRYLLVSCRGAQAALELEEHGCQREAAPIWTALIHEAPADPRWYLMAARNHLARRQPDRARQQLVHHLYLAKDRAAALLVQARMMRAFGHNRRAARLAVEAMAFAPGGPRKKEAQELLNRCRAEEKK